MIPIIIEALRTVPKSLERRQGVTGGQRKNRDHPGHGSVKISWSTQRSPEDV